MRHQRWDHRAISQDLRVAITTDTAPRGGRPRVRDLRISVGDVLGWPAQGMTPEQIVADYPQITARDIRACLACAAEREQHEARLSAAA